MCQVRVGDCVKVTSLAALAGWSKSEHGVQSDFGSGLRSILRRHTTPVIQCGLFWTLMLFFAATLCRVSFVTRSARRFFFPVEVQSESELRGSVDAAVALVGVITLWTSPPCSLASWP